MCRLPLFIISLFLICFPLLGQNISKIDSLKSLLESAKIHARIDLFNQIGWEYRMSYPDSTLYYCDQAIVIGEQYLLQDQIAQALNFKGIASMYKGNYSEAYHFHKKAQEHATNVGDSAQVAHAYNSLGRIYFTQGDLVNSYNHFFDALNIFEQIGDMKGMSYCYQSLLRLYEMQNDLGKALEMAKKAFEIREELHDERGQISSYQELAKLYAKLEAYDTSYLYFDRARAISEMIGDKISHAEINLSQAEVYFEQQYFDNALFYSNQALKIADHAENKSLLSAIYLVLGKIYAATDQDAKAIDYLLMVIEYAERTGDLEAQSDAYFYLSQLFEEAGDFQKALAFHEQFVIMKDSLHNVEKAKAIERLEARLEIERKENEYELLKATELQNQLVIREEKAKNVALTIIIISVLALAGVLWGTTSRFKKKNIMLALQKAKIEAQSIEISRQNQKIQEQNDALHKRNLKLAELNKEKDNLMSIVAHDLKSPLNSISSLVDLSEMVGNLNDEQEKYLTLIKKASAGGIGLIQDLLDTNAFENEQIIHNAHIEINAFLMNKINARQLDADIKHITIHHALTDNKIFLTTDTLYLSRILDNLISNAIKYSHEDSHIYVSACSTPDQMVNISVKDEGQGFSVKDKRHLYKKFHRLSAKPTSGEVSHGLGLAIVKTLIDRLGGEIELISEKGNGSEFIVKLPVNEKEPA